MKVRISKNWNPMADTYQLTKQDIEAQVLSDLARYRQRYSAKYQKTAPSLLDVDNYIEELWGFSAVFEAIPDDLEDEETLGYLRPENRQVVVDESCTNQKRISFTIAHEAGHLSLHGPLFTIYDGLITGWKDASLSKDKRRLDVAHIRREWQANMYAGALLAPRVEIENLLQILGLIKDNVLTSFNLDDHFTEFEEHFGLSRKALEIRLGHLGISFKGTRYQKV